MRERGLALRVVGGAVAGTGEGCLAYGSVATGATGATGVSTSETDLTV